MTTSKSKFTSHDNTTTTMNGNGNGAGAAHPARRSKRRRGTSSTTSIDDIQVDVIISPALQSQQHPETQNGLINGTSIHSRHKSNSKSKKSLPNGLSLALDTTLPNLNGNALRAGREKGKTTSIKTRVIDWEIPRKLLHSSIGFITLTFYLNPQTSAPPVIKCLSSALLLIVPCDYLRLRWPGPGSSFARAYERCVGFLMRDSEKTTTNGVIWYILGVNFALLVYPLDIAVVAILILSWADTAASTIGRLYGPSTPPLPPQTPILRLPLAPRKSTAGFVAATITGALITTIFYKYIGPLRSLDLSWTFEHGVRLPPPGTGAGAFVHEAVRNVLRSWGWEGVKTSGWVGLGVLGVVAGLVAGVAEALDLGSLDDNLTLPIISGGCIWGFFKLLSIFST
ncbi:hypothetical protein PILCRDRAFT_825231 [Piloderma croceum F 1598]|uniref:Phosphatidate cytidylyltransferase n=1 Tax=Piloderma croceum (strain F 1598) TaxID=765440 RepID=A0A0C3FD51_PILCF|nr:hypothetical protein PILCRDRAFT_825231 [Piloderma croceum F 1598]